MEGRDDIKGLAIHVAWLDGATVNHDRRTIQTPHGDQRAGHVLVATGDGHQTVIPLSAHHGLDRIGDDLTGLQRVAHAAGAHGDAIGDADGVETHTDHVGLDHALFHYGGKVVQVHVTGVAFPPDAGDTDFRLGHIGLAQACAVKHGL